MVLGRLTLAVLNGLLLRVRVLRIRLDMRVSLQMRHDPQGQLDHHDLSRQLGRVHAWVSLLLRRREGDCVLDELRMHLRATAVDADQLMIGDGL